MGFAIVFGFEVMNSLATMDCFCVFGESSLKVCCLFIYCCSLGLRLVQYLLFEMGSTCTTARPPSNGVQNDCLKRTSARRRRSP